MCTGNDVVPTVFLDVTSSKPCLIMFVHTGVETKHFSRVHSYLHRVYFIVLLTNFESKFDNVQARILF